ncbi:YkyA family protein [Alkalibacterium olivapovliticus]|uniref:Putative cell-wall binding lipoprotein n=1 Tax=Alkalibacterium olivapovliticus TaxID=99907 RepID=A0A2T0W9E0_9LACT|nr:YkyA family protein [Alkalibacterium olivapovliticus]PRY83303.1 putative cell-wall binding lipoprotein [Alkalibacterium olivapovliticus]
MIRKRYTLITISALSLLLAGCDDGENVEGMQEATEELDRLKTETVDNLNQLYDLEVDLQSNFSDTLETDDDLTTLGDGSSPVFENIESRQTVLDSIEENETEMEAHQDTLDSYEGERLNQDEIDGVTNNVDLFIEHLAQYRNHYLETLSSQEDYFTSIANDDATYDEFSEGIQSINEERDALRDHLLELDDILVDFSTTLDQLSTTIEDELAEEE